MTVENYAAISEMYALLSRLWIREVDEALQQKLVESEVIGELGMKPSDVADLESLAVEYCALFIGPKDHLPPIQSVWETGQLQTEISDSMQGFSELLNLSEPETMSDHLGNQLRVMSELTGLLSSSESATKFTDVASVFFGRHLMWAGPLLRAGQRKTNSAFYRSMFELTDELLTSETKHWVSV